MRTTSLRSAPSTSAALLIASMMLVGCSKDAPDATSPSTSASAASSTKGVEKAAATTTASAKTSADGAASTAPSAAIAAASTSAAPTTVDDPKGAKILTPAEMCDAMMKLANVVPPKAEIDKCVAEHEKTQKKKPERWACASRCIGAATDAKTGRHCLSMCEDPKTMCEPLAKPAKDQCLARLGKVYRGEVEPKAYACVATCIETSPEKADGLAKTIDCLGAKCGL